MDDLYDNLENYNEESTIAELQSENKELKSKLEGYATSLDKLQKDFDKLSSEYKKLEINYSSLMKTAKAEIERKTQMIKNLNLEKDKIIIESYQNRRNARSFQRNNSKERPHIKETKSEQKAQETKLQQKDQETNSHQKVHETKSHQKAHETKSHQKVQETKSEQKVKDTKYQEKVQENKLKQDSKSKDTNSRKVSPPSTVEKNDQGHLTSKDKSSVDTARRDKWLKLANSGTKQVDPRISKTNDIKERIVESNKHEKETYKSSALIRNRRKSMPAVCLELDKISTDEDDDIPSGGISKEITDKKLQDRKFRDRQGSRVSEVSSLEDRHPGRHETFSDLHRSRQSRFDSNRTDSYRTRHKSAHRYKRQSPDSYRRETNKQNQYDSSYRRAEHDLYNKSEHDRRRLESPPRDNFHWRRKREPPRNNYDRSQERYQQEPGRLQPIPQEMYPLKHKIQHNYDESDIKRMKLEPHYRQQEDLRLPDQFDNINFSSCESPDYNHTDVSTHPIREIKLYATTQLDDPRTSSRKYCLNKDNGNFILSTAQGRSVDIVPINKTAWGIEPVNIPDALIRRPSMEMETVQGVDEANVVTDMVHDVSMESGEISDHDNIATVSKETKKELCNVESKSIGNVQKSYRIPKLKKSPEDYQCRKSSKLHEKKCRDKTKKLDTFGKSHDMSHEGRPKIEPVQEKTISEDKQKKICIKEKTVDEDKHYRVQMQNELPFLGSSDMYEKQTNPTSKEVLACDLEMSDDNCDNIQQPDTSKNIVITHLENHEQAGEQNIGTEILSTDVSVNVKPKNSNITQKDNTFESGTSDMCEEKHVEDVKKSRHKKKSKRKEEKDSKFPVPNTEKPTKRKEKEIETKTKQIKTKFTELFDDSSSLISPEDLGLVAVPTTQTADICEKGIPLFEEAQDATDINVIREAKRSPAVEKPKDNTNHIDVTVDRINTEPDKTISEFVDKPNEVKTTNKQVNDNIYINLEPGVPGIEKNVVKTIIISTGVQPQIIHNEKQELASHSLPQLKTAVHGIALQALATSTPQKPLLPNVASEIEPKLPDIGCNTSDNRLNNIEDSATSDNSYTNNTFDSQNNTDVPDVRIVLKRRRKVVKK